MGSCASVPSDSTATPQLRQKQRLPPRSSRSSHSRASRSPLVQRRSGGAASLKNQKREKSRSGSSLSNSIQSRQLQGSLGMSLAPHAEEPANVSGNPLMLLKATTAKATDTLAPAGDGDDDVQLRKPLSNSEQQPAQQLTPRHRRLMFPEVEQLLRAQEAAEKPTVDDLLKKDEHERLLEEERATYQQLLRRAIAVEVQRRPPGSSSPNSSSPLRSHQSPDSAGHVDTSQDGSHSAFVTSMQLARFTSLRM